jgi:hypothetical protein
MQCPDIGGAAVYAARALYATVNDTLGFDDGYLCMYEDWYFRKNESSSQVINSISIYPNPADKSVNVNGLIQDELNSIEVLNTMGVRISLKLITTKSDVIDLTPYPNGIYFIKISNSAHSAIFKLIISR